MTTRFLTMSTLREAFTGVVAAGLLLASAAVAADPSGGPSGKGRDADGAAQRGAITVKPPVSESMPSLEQLQAGKAAERALVPLDKLHLPKDLRATILKKPTFEEAAKRAPKSASEPGPTSASGGAGRGVQATKLAPEALKVLATKPILSSEKGADTGHVRVLMRIRDDGSSEVVQAQKLPGAARKVDAVRGRWVAQVVKGSHTIAVQTLEDPFELRGIADPAKPNEGHSFSQAEEAFVTVDVPAASAEDVSVQLHRFKPDVVLPGKLDVQKFESLRGKFDTISRVPTDKLKAALEPKALVGEPKKLVPLKPKPDAKLR